MTLPVNPARYAAFLAVMVVLAFTPGPANLYAVATGVQRGKRAALLGVAGMNGATLVWFCGAALGLGALMAAVPQVFKVLTFVGAAYVAWLGGKALWAAVRGEGAAPAHAMMSRAGSPLAGGFAVQIANPKILLFFGAVLPPFLDPARPIAPQLALFACGTIGMDVISMSAYGLGGAALAERLSQPAFARGFSLFVGALLLTAAALIVTRR